MFVRFVLPNAPPQISRLLKLENLELALLPVDDAALRAVVSSCSSLTALNLSSCSQLGPDAPQILSMFLSGTLKSLKMDGCVKCKNLSDLQTCVLLETLSLDGCPLSSQDLCDIFPQFLGLRRLSLYCVNGLDNVALVTLADSPSARTLSHLNLTGIASFNDIGLEALVERARDLVELKVGHCLSIGDSLIYKLAAVSLKKLELLDLQALPTVSSEAVSALIASAPSLRSLNLADCYQIMKKHIDPISKTNPRMQIMWA